MIEINTRIERIVSSALLLLAAVLLILTMTTEGFNTALLIRTESFHYKLLKYVAEILFCVILVLTVSLRGYIMNKISPKLYYALISVVSFVALLCVPIGIYHSDISPLNVFIIKMPEYFITTFGLCINVAVGIYYAGLTFLSKDKFTKQIKFCITTFAMIQFVLLSIIYIF